MGVSAAAVSHLMLVRSRTLKTRFRNAEQDQLFQCKIAFEQKKTQAKPGPVQQGGAYHNPDMRGYLT
jgi:hypothetical protein